MDSKDSKISNASILVKEKFWDKHIALQNDSGLSQVAYCRNHNLNYDQFCYWKRRKAPYSSKLLPIKMNKEVIEQESLCTLILKNGCELKIHNQTILPFLISILG
jgi:hypothetical protein